MFLIVPMMGFAQAGTRQLEPGKPPRWTGPITKFDQHCSRPFKRERGLGKGLQGKICTYSFKFNDLSESDPIYDYGIVWAQISIDHKDLCFKRVDPKIVFGGLPPAYLPKVVAVAPTDPITIRQAAFKRSELSSSVAEAMTGQLATVSQRVRLYPKGLSEPWIDEDDNGNQVAKWSWKGNSGRPLAFAVGAVMAWRIDQAAALNAIAPGLHPLHLAFGSMHFDGGPC